jgi:hypothetical protein
LENYKRRKRDFEMMIGMKSLGYKENQRTIFKVLGDILNWYDSSKINNKAANCFVRDFIPFVFNVVAVATSRTELKEFFAGVKRDIGYKLFKRAYGNSGKIVINPSDYFRDIEVNGYSYNTFYPSIEWMDADTRIFYGTFQVLIDFVEYECARAGGHKPELEDMFLDFNNAYRNISKGLDYIESHISFCNSLGGDRNKETADAYEKIKALYFWFKNDLPKLQITTHYDFKELISKEDLEKIEASGAAPRSETTIQKIKIDKLKELIDVMQYMWI